MKRYLFGLFLATSFYSFAQIDYLEKIAIASCSCADSLSPDLKISDRNIRLGLCMINACEPYGEELLRDHQIDLKRIDSQGEELGVLVGIKMASICPDKLIELAGEDEVNIDSESSDEYRTIEGEGVVFSILEEPFVCFTIKDEEGRKQKYYWLTYVDSEMNIENAFNSLKGRKVYFEYVIDEIFDPRIREYRNINILVYLDI